MGTSEKPSDETIEMWQKDPNNWILGLFYFNKKDKRIIVQKRISIFGTTFNFANPISWLLTAFLIVLVIFFINK